MIIDDFNLIFYELIFHNFFPFLFLFFKNLFILFDG